MKVVLSLALLVLSTTVAIAQNTPADKCPSISVLGSPGSVNLGELGTFTATGVDSIYQVEYVWSVHGGQLRNGQGTSSISVIRRSDTVVASVKIKGLPAGCPSSASESVNYHPPILAIKIYENVPSEIFNKAAATRVAAVMLENPNNQLYILAGDVGRKNSPAFQQKQRTIIDLLTSLGITPDRITIARVFSDVELFKFWRVPPSASNPTCKECNEFEQARSECPAILVTGPATVTEPGGSATFFATLTGTIPENVRYVWSIDGGDIVDGQGTLTIRVRYTPTTKSTFAVTATLTVFGLSDHCSKTASATDAIAIEFTPEMLGAITNPTYSISRELLAKIGASLRAEPNSQLYVWVYLGADDTKFPELEARLLQQLSRTKVDRSRFTIKGTPDYGPRAAFWRIRPGVEIPAP